MQIIRTSFEIFPSKYLFEKFNDWPYADSAFKALLTDILQDKNLGINASLDLVDGERAHLRDFL